MKNRYFLFLLLITSLSTYAQIDSIHNRIFLVGDAGELHEGKQPVIDWLKKNVNWNDARNTLIFLGDNIYPLGLPMEGAPDYPESKRILDYQLNLTKGTKTNTFYVPGNHDWKNGKMGGWLQILNQHNYINGLGEPNIQSLPVGGCPGPIAVEVGEKVVVAFIDSQWFLYVHDKPGPGSDCQSRTVDEFETQLREIAATYQDHLLIVAMHHPMYSYGPHGGDYRWKEHIFPFTALNPKLYIPLPIIGSIYPIARGVFGNLQDTKHPLYQTMVKTIEDVIKEHPNAIHVAGHEHSLQLIMKDSIPYIVSGAAVKGTRVKENRIGDLLFADVYNNGFSLLEVRKSGKVEVKFYTVHDKNLETPKYAHLLKPIDTLPRVIPKDSIPTLPDSVLIAANPKMEASGLKRFLLGKNYRNEWTTPIRVPVLNLGKEQGGLTPEKQGGGKQTKSLRLQEKNGKEWVLRSVEKFPEAAIPPDLRRTIVHDLVADGISASYPFGGISIAPMADAIGIPILRRKIVYIPDDPRLGRFRKEFKNTLATLEEREPDSLDKTYNTEELVLRLAKDNDHHVDQEQVLKTRLLDNFYMDFDRHEDQWRWGTRDTGRGKVYFAIPRDQDQAFFINEGIIPYFIKKPWLVPELQGLMANTDNIKTFNRPARNFDRFFLNELDADVWSKNIDLLLTKMTDSVIEASLRRQPREIRNFRAQEIKKILKERREYYKKDMMEYYAFLSKEVNIIGTNQRELFSINKINEGQVHLLISKIERNGTIGTKIYERTFNPDVTKELRIYGLQDADSFLIAGGNSPIKIRIIGGPGEDHFANNGTGGNIHVYDVTFEENKFSGNENDLKKRISNDPRANEYNRLFFKYGYFRPGLSFAYNVDDGLFLGFQAEGITHGFRKEPYGMRQYLNINHALRTSSYRFRYEADFTKPIGNSDLLIRADVRAPINITNFFGFGNNTEFDKSIPGGDVYYRARYNIANVAVMLRRQLQSWMRIHYGPTVQYFHLEEDQNAGKYVSNTVINGLDPTTMYNRKWYSGAQFLLDINSRNNQILPTRGFKLDAGVRTLFGLNENSHNVTQVHWDMNIIASFSPLSRMVYAVRWGFGKNYGKFELPQAQYLSGPENLRGYRRNRFAGKSVVFQNLELRYKLLDFTTYLFPGSLGLQAFSDVGRVWLDGENSRRWHHGYGAGIWLSPIKRLVVTASIARSKEERALPYVTFGFQF